MAAAKRVAAGLQSAGFSVWFDEDLPTHRAYSDVIEEQLDTALAVLVLWSDAAVRSQWVRSEANRARESGRLVQARLDDTRLPMPFDQIQCADLRKWSDDQQALGWQRTLHSIGALANREAQCTDPASAQTAPRLINRRGVLMAAGAGTVVLGGVAAWQIHSRPQESGEAKLLLQKGLDALQSNDALDTADRGSSLQAIALLTDATKANPHSAMAWGGLAMAYAARKKSVPLSERAGLDSRARSAAKTALNLDAHEPRALGALLMLHPAHRNWLAAEHAARKTLQEHPPAPILLFILSDVLGHVGRWRDATEVSKKFDRKKFLIPGADRKVIINLWCSGDLQRADDALEIAVQHWPQHPQIWRIRLAYLMYSGRPSEALQILRNESERPPELTADFVKTVTATAESLASQRDRRSAIETNLAFLKTDPSKPHQIAQACAALGGKDEAIKILRGYYFAEGEWAAVAPPGGDQDRITSPLFQPPMASLWNDRTFTQLIEEIGLNAYWRRSGTKPDYQRRA